VEGDVPLARVPGFVVAMCGVVCLFFIGVRHGWLGRMLTQDSLGIQVDKWQIGPMRLLNLAAALIVCYWLRRYVVRLVAVEPFLTLGKASLQVFCAHVLFVFVGLALLYGDIPQLHGVRAYGMLALTFTGLILVALREVRLRRAERVAAAAPAGE
jgi:OpgC protein